MPTRTASAMWIGKLPEGEGLMRAGDGVEGPYSARSRFEDASGINPEALLGAAHAGCFSMALAARLSEVGHEPTRIDTVAEVHLQREGDGFTIERIDLS